MSVHMSISLWGVWYLQEKSTPKNEHLRLKILVFLKTFMKTLKVKKLVCPRRLDIHARNMKLEDFRFHSFVFSLSWVIGNTVLLKGAEEILRRNFHVMLNSKSYTYQSLRVKPLEISYNSVNFFSDRDEVLLVSEEFVLAEELGIRQCGLPTSEEHDSPEEFESSNFTPLLCYVPAVPKYLTHLTVRSLKGIYVLSCWAAP